MSPLRALIRGLRVLTRGAAADRELDEEVRHFYDEASADARARGATPADAQRSARLAFGDRHAIREEVRSHGWEHAIETTMADLRYAARGLRRRAGFSIAAALTLALGIGASSAIFSAVDPILFEPLPYPKADRIVTVEDRRGDGEPLDVTYGTYQEIAQRSRSFDRLAIADRWQPTVVGPAQPERLIADRVTSDYFRVLGILPAAGRDFVADDDAPGAARVAIVSGGFARRHFGAIPAALGRPLTLDDVEYTVIGVMPTSFENVLMPQAEVWSPRRYRARAPFESAEWGHHLRMVGRLRAAVSVEDARRELASIAQAPSAEFPRPPWDSLQQGLQVRSLHAMVTSGVRPALLAIFAAVTLVLMVAAVNVTNLLLARGAQRRGEFALRTALGAARGRIVRQLLTESVLLAAIGGLLGLAVAALGVHALVALAPDQLPRVDAIRLDTRVFAFATLLTIAIGLGVGVYPALQSAGTSGDAALQPGTRIAGAASHTLRRVLVVAEIALALVLLVGAGLMVRSLTRLMSISPGFDPSGVLTVQIDGTGRSLEADSARYQFFDQVLERVRRVPGVTTAALSSQLPLSGEPPEGYGVRFEAQPSDDPNGSFNGLRYAVTPGWFTTMRIPLRRGRLLDARDRPGAQEAVVISESLARQAFPGADPIGQRLRIGPEIGSDRPWDVVVGIVADVKQSSLASEDDGAAFYVATGQWSWVDRVQTISVRTSRDPATLVADVKAAIWSVDRNQPIIRVSTMDALVARSEAERRFVLTVFAAFGLAALGLAAIGIYGMVSGGVAERMTEIGVRAALGATRANILLMVLRQGVTLAVVGVGVGVVGATLLSSTLRTLIFGISRADAATYAAAVAIVLVIAVVASALPAARAARVNPSVALRV
jgi:putative ABC transport system permease protein